ncbi:MAG: zinc-binding dehydrogenase [Halioglobus sp.]
MMSAYRMMNWGEAPQRTSVEIPDPGPGQVLVKVAGVGVCGSDPKMRYIPEDIGNMLDWHMPFTLGHEVGGWIEAVGDGVCGFVKGEAVVLMSTHSCGDCSYCIEGADINCREGHHGRGYGRDGGLADYVLVEHSREILKINGLDPLTAGPLTDAGVVSYHGVKRVLPKLRPGSTAVVIGVGGLGSFACQFIKVLSSARVIAMDTNPGRLEYVRSLGVDEVIDSSNGDGAAQLQKLLGGEGAAAVLDFVGVDDTIETGVGCLRKGGSYGVIGAGGGTLKKDWYNALPKDGEIFSYQGATLSDMNEVIALAEAGKIRNDVDIYPFEDVDEAYAQLVRGELQGRAVIQFSS